MRLPGARPPTPPVVRRSVWIGDVRLLDVDRRPTGAAILGLGALVVLAFVVAFVLGTRAPSATRHAAPRTVQAPITTSLRLDPVPALPDLRSPAPRIRSARPARAAAGTPRPTPVVTRTAPSPRPTPAAPRPVQQPVTPSRPAPVAKRPAPVAKPKPNPAGQGFDSSG